jgi:hypothetical protein
MKPFLTACAAGAAMLAAHAATAMPPEGLPPEIFIAAPLSGANQAPPVETCAEGSAQLKFKRGVLTFRLNVDNIDNVVAAHLHYGEPGENGPVLVTLYEAPPPPPPALRGDDDDEDDDDYDDDDSLAFGAIADDDVEDADGVTFADGTDFDGTVDGLVRLLNEGAIYVNVHTALNPSGEIRAQAFRAGSGPNPNRGNGELCDDDDDCDDDCDCECECEDDTDGDDSQRLRADLNNDGVVNEADLRILLDSFTNNDNDDDANSDDDEDEAPRRRGRRGMIPLGG